MMTPRMRSCFSYFPWRMVMGFLLSGAGCGLWYYMSRYMFWGLSQLQEELGMTENYYLPRVKAGALAVVVVFSISSVMSLVLGFWRMSISKDVDKNAQASDSSSCYNILSNILVSVFWVMTVMSFIVMAYLVMLGTTGLYIHGVANVAYEVSAAESSAKIKTHTGLASDGICKADCINLAWFSALGKISYDDGVDINTPPCICGRARIVDILTSSYVVFTSITLIVVGFILQYIGSSWMSMSLTSASARTTKEAELIQRAEQAQFTKGYPAGNTV